MSGADEDNCGMFQARIQRGGRESGPPSEKSQAYRVS